MDHINKAVFLDRDGVLNKLIENRPPWKINEIVIFRSSKKLINLIKSKSYLPVVVTNQPDAARGDITFDVIDKINLIICSHLEIENYYICKHGYDGICECRKPKPGMLKKASFDLNIDLSQSLMIGDRDKDIQAGLDAGCKTVFFSKTQNKYSNYNVKNHKQMLDLLTKIL